MAILQTETLCWPAFVEFDGQTSLILTFSAVEKAYSIWTMSNYARLRTIQQDFICEIKMAPGLIVFIEEANHQVALRLFDPHSGRMGFLPRQLIQRNLRIELVEVFDSQIILKQEGCAVCIVDVRDFFFSDSERENSPCRRFGSAIAAEARVPAFRVSHVVNPE